jgi:anti-sigma-K factor RskA
MTHEELEEAVPLYAIGALERTERQAIEAHLLSGCATCHAALKDYQTVAALLPFGLTPATPPRPLKAQLMAARNPIPVATETGQASPRSGLEPGEWMNHLFPPISPVRSWPFRLAMGFAAVLILAGTGYLGWLYYMQTTHSSGQIAQLQAALQREAARATATESALKQREQREAALKSDLDHKAQEITELKDQLIRRDTELDDVRTQLAQRDTSMQRVMRQSEEVIALLKSPSSKVVSLAGSDVAKDAGALFLFDLATKKAWLYAFNLPQLPGGKVYQLWAIDERPVSAGIFGVDSGQKGRLLIKNMPGLSRMKKFAVTLEPDGGRPQPTGAIYLVGQT